MTHSPEDRAFKLRFRAEVLEKSAAMSESDGADGVTVAEVRERAADLKRQAFRIEETGR